MDENILLIDVDSTIPNAALTQISGYHKEIGDTVSLNIPNDPKKVYISCVYKENRGTALGQATIYENAEVYIGGSGINYAWLPEQIQKHYPDYSLYDGKVCQKCGHLTRACKCRKGPTPGDMFFSLGFTTRGCVRRCQFCIVYNKEGKLHRWQHPKEFHNTDLKEIMLLDNNWLANKDWFMKTSKWILDHKLKIIEHGMDIRLIDEEIAGRLKELKWHGTMHFAFDNMKDEKAVRRGIEILKQAGIDVRHRVQFYVLVGFDSSQEEDKYRCRLLKKLGTNAFVMPYVKNKWTKKITWWANRKWAYWSCDIDEVDRIMKYPK